MRVSVIINPKAGSVKGDLIEQKIREALFRCDLNFHWSKSVNSMRDFLLDEIAEKTDAILICGGDGTVNANLQILMTVKAKIGEIPPVCLVKSGTANDLAHEIGISKKIDQAARLILEGKEKYIDVIQINAGAETRYMITNGGVGVPALTADRANSFRGVLQSLANDEQLGPIAQYLSGMAYQVVKKAGSLVYIAMLLETLRKWSSKDWRLEVTLPNLAPFISIAPFVLVSNQPTLAEKFLTAPSTSNSDGRVNLLFLETLSKMDQLTQIVKVYRRNLRESEILSTFEVSEVGLKSLSANRLLTYFGDGEVLFRDVPELHIKCLHRALAVMVEE